MGEVAKGYKVFVINKVQVESVLTSNELRKTTSTDYVKAVPFYGEDAYWVDDDLNQYYADTSERKVYYVDSHGYLRLSSSFYFYQYGVRPIIKIQN